MSNNKRVNRKRRRSPWYKMFAKTETRLSARVTSEEDWQTDVPNIRLSRAFVIVILMHVVVIGSVVAFTTFQKSDAAVDVTDSVKQEKSAVAAVAKNETKSESKPVATRTMKEGDRLDDMRRHIVHSGDSVSKIAREYGVSSEEIHAVNRIDELYQLYQGRVLRIPVSASKPVDLNPRMAENKPSANTNGSNFVKTEQSRTQPSVPRADVIEPIQMKAAAEHEPIEKSLLPEAASEVSRPVVVEEVPRVERTIGEPGPIVRPTDMPAKPYIVPVVQKTPEPKSDGTYKVVKGDNAFRIGQKFGIHYKELLKHNRISDPSSLQIGQVLSIPN